MEGNTPQTPKEVPYTPRELLPSPDVALVPQGECLLIQVFELRHRNGSGRSRNLVHHLYCAVYRPDGSILHSIDAKGPDSLLAEHLDRIFDLARTSRGIELGQRDLRNAKRRGLRLPSTKKTRNNNGKDG